MMLPVPLLTDPRRFITRPNLRACIRYLNEHYTDGPSLGDTDLEVHGRDYGDVAGRVAINELFDAEGGGRTGIVAVWNVMENLGRRE